jgi:hypothetical protein
VNIKENNSMAEGKMVSTAAVVDTVPAAAESAATAESVPAAAESVPAAAESFLDVSTSVPTAVESVTADSDPVNDPSGSSDRNKFHSLFSLTRFSRQI